ncbi:hypothetical protein ACHAW5_010188 [Stephanodiscus triporus]|uniref:PDZ domain-containing protein n=1 Tax=Stephanodiscus triporus TaxID=2934178 RepID=A0ABD3PNN5_9STRA
MNVFSSTILLALLSSIDLSFSFLADPRRPSGNVNAANVGEWTSQSSFRGAGSKSRLFYYGEYDDNFLGLSGAETAPDGAGLLRRASDAPRGGGGGGVANSSGGGGGAIGNNNREYAALSVAELKRLLNDRGVDYRDCLEKRDLVERLISSRGLAPSSSASTGSDYDGAAVGSGLSYEENRVVNTFTKASPAVAYIQTISQQQVVQRGFSLKGTEVPTGAGSGFLWDDKGHIVTNYHVIASATKANNPVIKVKLQGMPPQPATIVGYEPEKDLAVLRISSRNLPKPISVGSSNDLQVGQNVLAIGNPFGLDYTLTTGVVSALGRDVDGVGGRPIKGCIQSDAAINPGNSGGPLLDSRGRLIGVNMAIYSPSGASAGIGFSIPVDTVRRVVNQIIRYGRVVRPTMGVNVADDRVLRSIAMQLRNELNGVLVVEVLPGSPAETAGLKTTELRSDGTLELGDLITEINGEVVVSVEDLLSAIEARSDGDTVSVKVWRKCDKRLAETVQVKLIASDKLQRGGISQGKKATSSVGSRGAWQ